MGKLMKYEFRKQLTSKLIVFAMLGVIEIGFFIGILADKTNLISICMVFLYFTAIISMFYFGFESIFTFSNDLKTKQSYMLFLVPRSAYQVVGAKILTTVIQTFAAAIAYVAVGAVDGFVLCARYGSVKQALEAIREMLKAFTGIEIDVFEIIWLLLMVLVTWLVFITMAIFAITLSATLLANTKSKWKGFISFLIYIALNRFFGKIAELLLKDRMFRDGEIIMNSAAWAFVLFYVLVLVLGFLGTAYLLEKKISV